MNAHWYEEMEAEFNAQFDYESEAHYGDADTPAQLKAVDDYLASLSDDEYEALMGEPRPEPYEPSGEIECPF